jgi:hypothetical protein
MLVNVFHSGAERFELCRDTDGAHVESNSLVFELCGDTECKPLFELRIVMYVWLYKGVLYLILYQFQQNR